MGNRRKLTEEYLMEEAETISSEYDLNEHRHADFRASARVLIYMVSHEPPSIASVIRDTLDCINRPPVSEVLNRLMPEGLITIVNGTEKYGKNQAGKREYELTAKGTKIASFLQERVNLSR